jgi:hypothetical protein
MRKYFSFLLIALLSQSLLMAQTVPSPKSHFGFNIGDNYQLATFTQTEAYLKKLAAVSKKVKLQVIGKTEEGRNQYMVIVSDPSNLANLEKYKTITYIPTTGNHALDMAIIAHNFGQTKALSPWCKTSHELYLTNCKNNTPYQIFKTSNDFENFSKGAFMRSVTDENLKKEPGNVTIFKDKTVLDFLPNLSSSSSSKSHTTISYLTNAIKFYEGLNCIK